MADIGSVSNPEKAVVKRVQKTKKKELVAGNKIKKASSKWTFTSPISFDKFNFN